MAKAKTPASKKVATKKVTEAKTGSTKKPSKLGGIPTQGRKQ